MWILLLLALGSSPEETPFADPVRMEAGGAVVKSEEPGYAAPATVSSTCSSATPSPCTTPRRA